MDDTTASNLPATVEANAGLSLRWIEVDTIRKMASLHHDLYTLAMAQGSPPHSPLLWPLTASATGVILAAVISVSSPVWMPTGTFIALFAGMAAVSFPVAFFIQSFFLQWRKFNRAAAEFRSLARRPGMYLQFRSAAAILHVAMLVRRFRTLAHLREQGDALLGEIPDRDFDAAREFLEDLHAQARTLADILGREGGFTTVMATTLVSDRLQAIQQRMALWIPHERLWKYLPATITPEELFQLFMEIDERVGK